MKIKGEYGAKESQIVIWEKNDDIEVLADFMQEKNVAKLSIDHTINDINLIGKLDFIDELYMYGNEIKDITPLYNLKNLTFLYLLNKDKEELDLLEFPLLRETVLIKRNGIKNLFNHPTLTDAKLLDFKSKKEFNVGDSFLKSLSFKNSHIVQLPELRKINGLKSLELAWVRGLTDSSFLRNIKDIEILDITLCKNLSSTIIHETSSLKSLKKLFLSKMGTVPSIQELAYLPKLEELYITEGTKIEDGHIHFLLKSKSLKKVSIQGYKHYDFDSWELKKEIAKCNLEK